jgi:NitT/TauT family transport system ATP-binding protein
MTRDRLHIELENLWLSTGKTILFVTHNVREAVALGDRVLVFSPRPGRVIADYKINLPRPRSLEDLVVINKTAEIMQTLRQAIASSSVSQELEWQL